MNDVMHSAAAVVPRRTIMLLQAAAFASSVNLRVCDPLLPQVAHAFSTTPGVASAMVTAFAIAYGLFQLAWGPLGDRAGKYRVAAWASLATGIFTAAGSFAPTLDVLAIARFLAGGMAAAIIPLAFAWIGDAFPFQARQAVLARFLSAQFAGFVLAQAGGGLLGDAFGWRSAFLVIAVVHLSAGALMLVELKANPAAQPIVQATAPGWRATLAVIRNILARRWALVMLFTVFVEAFAMYGAFAYIGADLHQRFGLGFAMVGIALSAYGAGALAYSLSARALVSRLGERGLVLVGGLLMAFCYVVLAAASNVYVAAPAVAVIGLGFYMFHNTLQTHATQLAPESRGLGVSLFALSLFLGQSIGVACAAPVVDRWGAPPAYLAAAVMLPLIAVWFCRRLRMRAGAA